LRAYQKGSLSLGTKLEILFYTREGCLLCDEFEAILEALLSCRGLAYQRIDVGQNLPAKERFGKRIPVLAINGEVAAEGRTTPASLEDRVDVILKKISGPSKSKNYLG
jgi:hypothetical protein